MATRCTLTILVILVYHRRLRYRCTLLIQRQWHLYIALMLHLRLPFSLLLLLLLLLLRGTHNLFMSFHADLLGGLARRIDAEDAHVGEWMLRQLLILLYFEPGVFIVRELGRTVVRLRA